MPKEYYTNMLSLRADILIVTKILTMRDKKLMQHLDDVGMDISLIMVESFITLFTTTCHPELTDVIIDHFVIDGAVVLIKAMVLILSYLRSKLMKLFSFSDTLIFFKTELKTRFVDPKKLSSDMMNLYLSKYLIGELRDFYTIKERNRHFENKCAVFSNNIICKAEWPVCYHALETLKATPEAAKSSLFKGNFIMDNFKFDYFSNKRVGNEENKIQNNRIKYEKREVNIEEDDLLIDRQRHTCKKKNRNYERMRAELKGVISNQVSDYNLFLNSQKGAGSPFTGQSDRANSYTTVKAIIKHNLNSPQSDDQDENSSSESQNSDKSIRSKGKRRKKKDSSPDRYSTVI